MGNYKLNFIELLRSTIINNPNPHNMYVGYWCFQAAAITKIMKLDDSSYRDNQYYPKDIL